MPNVLESPWQQQTAQQQITCQSKHPVERKARASKGKLQGRLWATQRKTKLNKHKTLNN